MTSDSATSFPDSIGPYIPLRLLGTGGMADVYLCVDPRGMEVAVKWLRRNTGRIARRFDQEIQALRRIRHPRVVRYIDHGLHGGRPYLVIDYVEGQDLVSYSDKLHLRPAHERHREARRIGLALCDALEAVHDAGIVHRDVKPGNVLLDQSGRVILSDFGVILDRDVIERTKEGVLVGTPAYGAPEQLQGLSVDFRADLYSLGCTLYVLLTGRRPFNGEGREAMIRAHLHEAPTPPSAIEPSVPPSMETVVLRLMSKDPKDRYPSARAARAALEQSVDSQPPPPLAGRQRYVDQVHRVLDGVEAGEGRILRVVEASGSGRSWLLEVVEDLAGRRGVPVVIARDKPTLSQGLKRLRKGGPLLLATRFKVPAGLHSDVLILEPLGPADLRRTVVSVAKDTPEPHMVADRLFRATGGHPAWLLPVLEAHTRAGVCDLPDPVPVPEIVTDVVEELPVEAMEALSALALLQQRATPELLEQVTQLPTDEALPLLVERGLVVEHAGRYSMMGDIVRDAALENTPDPVAIHRRAALAFEREGDEARAHAHRVEAGDATGEGVGVAAQTTVVESLAGTCELHLRGRLEDAWQQIEGLLGTARARRDRDLELQVLHQMGRMMLDRGDWQRAQSRLADAVALARALDEPSVRRRAHLLRALAALERRPGAAVASSAALDRVHRALSSVPGSVTPQETALAAVVQARAYAAMRDLRSYEKALARAHALMDLSTPEERLRLELELARAARAMGRLDESRARAEHVAIESANMGWRILAWLARREVARALKTRPPEPRSLAEGLEDYERELLSARS